MSMTTAQPELYQDQLLGTLPTTWVGTQAVDGDAGYWLKAPVGSIYYQKDKTNDELSGRAIKLENNSSDYDWYDTPGVVQQTVALADFTDGGAAVGTLVLNGSIPKGAFVERVILVNVTGFAGDTSASLQVGDGTDADRYNAAADIDVFSDVGALDGGAPQGTQIHAAAVTTITLTITTAADWGSVTAGGFTIRILYR